MMGKVKDKNVLKTTERYVSGDPAVKTALPMQGNRGSLPDQGTRSQATKSSNAKTKDSTRTAKTRHSQISKYIKKIFLKTP